MRPARRRGRFHRRRAGVSEIIGAILLLALTLAAGAILWSFQLNTPPSAPAVSFLLRSGGSNPVWGDGTDCNGAETACTTMNTSQIIVATHSPATIPLNLIVFTFVCDNTSTGGNRTDLVTGTLASMTWYPGSSTQPAANAPSLGWCANYHDTRGSNSELYNRLGMFVPITPNAIVLENGDTFILYLHTGCYPTDWGEQNCDSDDYHGAPPWCFQIQGACTILLSYIGNPTALLATIPVYSLAPPGK